MRSLEIITAIAAVAPFVAAHGDYQGMPKIFGLGAGSLRPRDFGLPSRRADGPVGPVQKFNKRQGGVDGRCGSVAGGASCAAGYCCSSSGWCGNTAEYCSAPDCQIDFGPGCHANRVPNGASTRNVARPQLGSVAYGGEGVYPCKTPGTIAITYDDGPYIYTNKVLDQFAAYGAKATFFVTGINNGKGAIDDAGTAWPAVITRMNAEGHQIASHTWSHQDLSVISQAQRIDQMVRNEMAIRNIIQKFPTYMRPPYSSCNSACQADMKALGYVITYFDLDTDDYNNLTPEKIINAKNNFKKAVETSNPSTNKFLAIGHDIHEQTALNLTGYMLDMIKAKGYRAVTVGECLGEPPANWYRASSGNVVSSSSAVPSATKTSASSTKPTATPTGYSTNGECGPKNGLSCIGYVDGSCCSQYGYCGASTDHCGTGCNPLFGTCGSSSTAKPTTVTNSAPTATPSNLKTSTDGTCGGTSGFTCRGFANGQCCSQYGWCGSSTEHCGVGCNPLAGTCTDVGFGPAMSSASILASSPSSSIIPPPSKPISTSSASSLSPRPSPSRSASSTVSSQSSTPTQITSTNGKCGAQNRGMTCKGYRNAWGIKDECCGSDGRCATSFLACSWRCDSKFGTCWR